MANKFIVATAPHMHSPESTKSLMRDVLIALMPALAVSTWVYGLDALRVTAIAVVSCVVIEYLIQKFLFKGASTVGNLSAVVTGVLLAFNLPANIAGWIVVVGSLVAIGIAKMTFGGLGRNPFNPALVGRVFLLIAYPAQMTSFPQPAAGAYVDAFAGATPLAALKAQAVQMGDVNLLNMLAGVMPGSMGEIAAAALIAGGLYMLWRRVITWHIPVAVLGSMAVFACIVAFISACNSSLVCSCI